MTDKSQEPAISERQRLLMNVVAAHGIWFHGDASPTGTPADIANAWADLADWAPCGRIEQRRGGG
jgi:hypothetical protein